MSGRKTSFRVVGVTFVPDYPNNMVRLHEMVQNAAGQVGWDNIGGDAGVDAVLVRNPDNEYDENAIEVHVPALGRTSSMIGHVPADLAAKLAPSLDRGDEWAARLDSVLFMDGHSDRPGALLTVEHVRRNDEQLLRGA